MLPEDQVRGARDSGIPNCLRRRMHSCSRRVLSSIWHERTTWQCEGMEAWNPRVGLEDSASGWKVTSQVGICDAHLGTGVQEEQMGRVQSLWGVRVGTEVCTLPRWYDSHVRDQILQADRRSSRLLEQSKCQITTHLPNARRAPE